MISTPGQNKPRHREHWLGVLVSQITTSELATLPSKEPLNGVFVLDYRLIFLKPFFFFFFLDYEHIIIS